MPGRRTDVEARETRQRIVRRAAELASERGIQGLSIGLLAADLDMSKSGVIGPFGSKEQLQLAALDEAVRVFMATVWEPVAHERAGLDRLVALCDSWTAYVADPPLPGGCVLAAAPFEWDSRVGEVRRAIQHRAQTWTAMLREEVLAAVDAGELDEDTDVDVTVFTLEAIAAAATPARQLHDDPAAVETCRRAMLAALRVGPSGSRWAT